MAIWDDVITEQDRQVFELAGWGRMAGYGQRPVLLVVDVNYNFCGDRPEPILESIRRWRFSCGERAWQGVAAIQRLLAEARQWRIPVFYTTTDRRADGFDLGKWPLKSYRSGEDVDVGDHLGNRIVAEVAPRPEDVLIHKKKPSAFFGTPLLSYLIELRADTVIITGTTTSGCVRATAVDAFSYNFFTVIPEECVWDRGEVTHKVNLFDLQQKYADVRSLDEVLAYIRSLPRDLYADVKLWG